MFSFDAAPLSEMCQSSIAKQSIVSVVSHNANIPTGIYQELLMYCTNNVKFQFNTIFRQRYGVNMGSLIGSIVEEIC